MILEYQLYPWTKKAAEAVNSKRNSLTAQNERVSAYAHE
jgi:hypothetical protein